MQLLLCVFGMLLWILAGTLQLYAAAADSYGSLTMICQTEDGIILEGGSWKIYHVADRNADGELRLQGDFRYYPVYLGDTSESALREAAETLKYYTVSGRIEPDDEGVTDASGRVKFDSLTNGLYLLVGDYVSVGRITYCYVPFLIEVPAPDTNDLDLIAYPKSSVMSWSDEPVEYTVKKIWQNDEDMPELRAVSITAEIYSDGELYDTIVLDDSNDWTYSWNASASHEWSIIEVDVPRDYAVIYTSSGVQYAIVNTYYEDFYFWEEEPVHTSIAETTQTETNTTPVTDTSVTTAATDTMEETTASASQTTAAEPSNTTITSVSAATSITTTVTTAASQTSNQDKLPQTGQLWWPVPLLVIAGLFSITAGLKLHSKE